MNVRVRSPRRHVMMIHAIISPSAQISQTKSRVYTKPPRLVKPIFQILSNKIPRPKNQRRRFLAADVDYIMLISAFILPFAEIVCKYNVQLLRGIQSSHRFLEIFCNSKQLKLNSHHSYRIYSTPRAEDRKRRKSGDFESYKSPFFADYPQSSKLRQYHPTVYHMTKST